ncbi:MAG: hypothetical protein SVP26_05545 [Chloroflexota bacterium]|nr:hypothetical protein [Chloroflexota bacterium]
MRATHRASVTLVYLGALVAGLCLCVLLSGPAAATPFTYEGGVSPLKWPVGNQTHPKVIKVCIQEDPNKPPDRSALLKEGMERWNAELEPRGLKLEVTVGIPDPPTGCDATCKYGSANDTLQMDQGDPEAPKLDGNDGLAGCGGGNGNITGGEILIKANLPAHNDRWQEKIRNLGAHEITHILGLADDDDGNVTDHDQGLDRADFNAHDRSEISTLYPVLGQSESEATGTQQSSVPHQYDWAFVYAGPEDGHVTLINLDIDPSVIDTVIPPEGWVAFNPADPAHLVPEYPFYQGYMVDGHPVPAPWSPEVEFPLSF